MPTAGVSISSRTPAICASDNEVGRDRSNFTKESWRIRLEIVLNRVGKSGAGSTFPRGSCYCKSFMPGSLPTIGRRVRVMAACSIHDWRRTTEVESAMNAWLLRNAASVICAKERVPMWLAWKDNTDKTPYPFGNTLRRCSYSVYLSSS